MHQTKPRILHVIPTLGSGGAERVLLTYLSQPALNHGFQHLVVLTDVADPHVDIPETFLVKLLEEQGVEVVGLGLPESRNIIKSTVALNSLIRDRKIDLVHSQLVWANISGRLAGRLAGIPVIASFHSTDYAPEAMQSFHIPKWKQELIQRIDSFTTRWFVKKSIAVSKYVADHIEAELKLDPSKIQVIYNPIDFRQIQPSTTDAREKIFHELGINDECKLILSVGRVIPSKGFLELVEAFSRLDPKLNVFLAIVGAQSDSQHLRALQSMISDKRLVGKVYLAGARRDISNWLAAADIFAFPTKYEGLPVALAEAMASGVACVASDVGPMPELITHEKTGIIFPVGDINALAQSIALLLTNDPLRETLGEAGQKSILQRFNPDVKSQEMADLYVSVIQNHARC
jgi:glycosyltransferase involved in cell wall biosynthesis